MTPDTSDISCCRLSAPLRAAKRLPAAAGVPAAVLGALGAAALAANSSRKCGTVA
jgi:hypothetical protein